MRILVIEDEKKHIQDARTFFAGKPDTAVVFASDFASAQEHLEPGRVDGVISDIFFSYSDFVPAGIDWDGSWRKNACCGVAVMMICLERMLPCVLITDKHHHGDSLQWICLLQRGLLLPEIVDVTTFEEGADWRGKKNWDEALHQLRRLIELGPCKKHNRYDWNVIQMSDGSFRRTC